MAENVGYISFNRKNIIEFHDKMIASFTAGIINELHLITPLFLLICS